MPIDPNIPLQAKNPQIETGINQLASMGEAMKIGEMQRGIGVQNQLRNLYSQGVDPSTPEGFRQLASVDPATAMKLRTQGLEGRKLEGEIKKTGFELTARGMDIMRERTKDILQNPSPENFIAHTQEGVRDGLISPEQGQRSVQTFMSVPPDQRVTFLTQSLARAEKLYEMNTISKSQQQTADIQKGQLDVSRGNLQIARENQQRGTIPSGYRMSADGKNLEAIPGGPTTVPLAPKELQAREAKYPMATQAVKTVESKSDKLIADIETLKNHPGLDSITGTVYGRTPSVTSEGRSAQALYDSIIARGGFQELAAMRAASPTGGALGNVSNQEGQQLKDAFGTLNRTQDAADLRKQLGRVADDVRGAKTRIREAYDMTYDYKPSTAPSGGGGGKDDPLGIR